MVHNNTQRVVNSIAVTPSDTVKNEFDCLWIGTAGDLEIIPALGNERVLYKNVPIGRQAISTKYICSEKTTCQNIVGEYVGK